ncbi:MAG: HYR domain-containing protein, partial [Planctomycetota bacterium]
QAADPGVGDGCQGAVVTFTIPGATDNCGGVTVTCDPDSGDFFPVGDTVVTCTATDDCGNTDSCTFTVTVTETNVVNVTVVLTGSTGPVTRCIHFVTDDCSVTADIELDFDAGGVFTGPIEVPCGNWTQLCSKDEQHTKWDTTALTPNVGGTEYDASTTLVLDPGDTDNDGDVDINDVTFLIATFGDLAASGGCPYNGFTRDADFDNGGAVGSEDYSLFSAEWLTLSACACVDPLHAPGHKPTTSILASELDPWVAKRTDLNRDGTFDVVDVVIFETRNGLAPVLSSKFLEARTAPRRGK